MNSATTNIDLQGAMDLIGKSRHTFSPLYEAITNSLEAIFQKQYAKNEKPEITVTFYFTGLTNEVQNLDRIEVTDNGIGFNELNYKRFQTLLDKSKGYNNRGSGRIQLLYRFDKIEIVSYYVENSQHYKRSFSCNTSQFIFNHKNEADEDQNSSGSTIALIGSDNLDVEKEYFDKLEITDVVRDLKKYFLLRFYLDIEKKESNLPAINIVFLKNEKPLATAAVKPEDAPKPQATGEIKVSYVKIKDQKSDDIEWVPIPKKAEPLKWAHFRLPENDLEQNGIYLCSKDVPVEQIPAGNIKKSEAVDGHRYLTAFYGDVLDKDKYVNHRVDSFCFPDQAETEKKAKSDLFFDPEEEFLFFDSIRQEIEKVIPQIYTDVVDLKKQQEKNIEAIAKAHGISLEIAKAAKINLSDDEEKITDKLYKKQAEYLSKENQRIQKVFEELSRLNPASDTYQQDLEGKSAELLEMIPQQNKEELGRYVIRREMVTKVIRMILDQKLESQSQSIPNGKRRDKEGLIHDLIFKRKSKNTDGLNDLWILNEEYVHFEGCSDLPLNQIKDAEGNDLLRSISDADLEKYGIKPDRRPDIFLYAEEGKCIIVELKEPNTDLSEYLHQLPRYCNLIANFSVQKIEKFYCYLIGESINRIDLTGDYKTTVNGDWIKFDLPVNSYEEGKQDIQIASAQIEIVKLSSIYARAHRRNKSFADKLGISDILEE
ncbi:MAG: hypothetical protein H6869_01860 [Rhodospirillales bacterium]|nr:hypothetical protein [Rhodospirillales bacterium]